MATANGAGKGLVEAGLVLKTALYLFPSLGRKERHLLEIWLWPRPP